MSQAVAIILVIGTVQSALILKVIPNSCKINELNPDEVTDVGALVLVFGVIEGLLTPAAIKAETLT